MGNKQSENEQPEKKPRQWKPAGIPGVRYREHATRKNGAVKKDQYFSITYWWQGKTHSEGVGWASEGITRDKAAALLSQLKENQRLGRGPATFAEMRAKNEAEKQAQKEAEMRAARDRVVLSVYWDDQYLPYAKRTKKKSSWTAECSHYTTWLCKEFGSVPLTEIGLQQWDTLVTTLHKAGLSQRSIEYISGTLRRVLKHAQERGLPVTVPTAKQIGATAPKNNRRQRVINADEREKILSFLKIRDIHAWRVTYFAFLTGCRASEAFLLQWRSVDMAGQFVTFEDTKNKTSRRVALSPALMELLKELPGGNPGDVVFPNSQGNPYTSVPTAFTNTVKVLNLNEGRGHLDRISFHSIRHSVATALAKSVDLRTLMDTLGWNVPAMALRYMHANESAQRDAMAALGREMSKTKATVLPFEPRKTQAG